MPSELRMKPGRNGVKRISFGPSPTRSQPSPGRKRHVLARDGGICWICGGSGADTVDHVKPRARGGSNGPENLKAAHAECNRRRGDSEPGELTEA